MTKNAPPGALFSRMIWGGVERLRERWPGKLVLKGMLNPDDAERAVAMRPDRIVVSNRGNRALDSAVATLDALPAIVQPVNNRTTIFLQSGVRGGSDVKAIALGADVVLVGRAPL